MRRLDLISIHLMLKGFINNIMFIEEIMMGDLSHKTYVNIEERKLLDYFKYTVKLYEHELNDREKNVARLMVEKSVLLRKDMRNKTYFVRNIPNV